MSDPQLEAAKNASVAQLLFKAARLWNEAAVARLQSEHPVRLAHTRLFPHIGLAPTRASDIAERAGISKQAVSKTLAELEALGVVERLPDPRDRRARLVQFTPAGVQALLHGLATLQAMEAELRAQLGDPALDALRDHLPALITALSAVPDGGESTS